VTKSTALGAELAYQYGPQVPGGEVAMLSGAARYTGGYLLYASFDIFIEGEFCFPAGKTADYFCLLIIIFCFCL